MFELRQVKIGLRASVARVGLRFFFSFRNIVNKMFDFRIMYAIVIIYEYNLYNM